MDSPGIIPICGNILPLLETSWGTEVDANASTKKWIAVLLLFLVAVAPSTLAQNWPIRAQGRYFVESTGTPWIMVGDNSGYNLIAYETMANIDNYFADRSAHGFTAVWMNVILGTQSQTSDSAVLYDGTPPFTSPSPGTAETYNFATPNAAYWAEIDTLVSHAASHGLVIAMIPFETGLTYQNCPASDPSGAKGWLIAARNQSTIQGGSVTNNQAMFNYGVFLGNRYKNSTNVIWVLGYDFQTNICTTGVAANDSTLVANLIAGINSVDPNHIVSEELNFNFSYTTQNSSIGPYVTANGVYTYGGLYDEILAAYNNIAIPAFLVEGNWEFQNNTGALSPWPVSDNNPPCGTSSPPCPAMDNTTYAKAMRLQWWWTMTSGGAGFFYGNPYGSNVNGVVPGSWWPSTGLDTAAIGQLGYVTKFFAGILWQSLVPDQTHQVVTAGYGTYCGSTSSCLNQLSNNYVTTAWNPNGSLAVIYNPQGNALTVDMNRFAGPVTAYWYDPTKGTYTVITGSPFTNSGSHFFSTPGTNSVGLNDWVLLLTASSGAPRLSLRRS
ncbi:MAG: DUF4038 domain-containing protein [Candidatus Acidiferrum sp.]